MVPDDRTCMADSCPWGLRGVACVCSFAAGCAQVAVIAAEKPPEMEDKTPMPVGVIDEAEAYDSDESTESDHIRPLSNKKMLLSVRPPPLPPLYPSIRRSPLLFPLSPPAHAAGSRRSLRASWLQWPDAMRPSSRTVASRSTRSQKTCSHWHPSG